MNCSRQTIYKIIDKGKLNAINLNKKKIFVKRSDLDKLFKNE
ncbi:MAG: helix-turn-helix domain-containing protein [Flavobacteriaceae bacterium]|nr:helix-turn-helix domain-containing protein [Flavobacteriaceae bacterium]